MGDTSNTNKQNNRILLSVCIGIAALIWFVSKLSQTTPWTVSIPIEIKIPKGYVAEKQIPNHLELKVEGTGWSLWRISNKLSEKVLFNADAKLGSQNWSFDQLKQILRKELDLPDDILVRTIVPSRIGLSLSEAKSKCVPVRLPTKVAFENSYGKLKPISLSPDTICLTGPDAAFKALRYIVLDTLTLSDVNRDQKGSIAVQSSIPELLRSNTKSIDYHIEVSEFTELNKYVPIRVLSSLKDSIEIFPKSALVTMEVPLNKYDQLEAGGIGLYIEIPDQVSDNSNVVKIQTPQNLPYWLKINSVQPASIEYYIVENTADSSKLSLSPNE